MSPDRHAGVGKCIWKTGRDVPSEAGHGVGVPGPSRRGRPAHGPDMAPSLWRRLDSLLSKLSPSLSFKTTGHFLLLRRSCRGTRPSKGLIWGSVPLSKILRTTACNEKVMFYVILQARLFMCGPQTDYRTSVSSTGHSGELRRLHRRMASLRGGTELSRVRVMEKELTPSQGEERARAAAGRGSGDHGRGRDGACEVRAEDAAPDPERRTVSSAASRQQDHEKQRLRESREA